MKQECHYCHNFATCQMDHFPVPARLGGKETVPACTTCHNMKDRIPAEKWPKDILFPALQSFVRIWLESGKPEWVGRYPECLIDLEFDRDFMDLLPPMARVLYAKTLFIACDARADQNEGLVY